MAEGIAITAETLRRRTAPALLCGLARTAGDRTAFRSKHLGIYRERSWRDYARLVARTAKAFADLGLRAGERVAIMGESYEEWVICDLAAQALGAIVYGIYPTASAAEVEYQMRDGGAALFVAEDQEYVDRLLPLTERLPDLRHVIVVDDSAMFGYDHPKLVRYQGLTAAAEDNLDWLEMQVARLSPDDAAFVVYTSGTTGHPKGALVAHGKHLAAAANLVSHYPTLATKQHRTVAYLPLCHILGRDVAVTLPLISQLVPHFGEDAGNIATTLFEVAPTVLFTVPRYLQKFAAQILVGIRNSSPIKRAAYTLAMRMARRNVHAVWAKSSSGIEAAAYALAHTLVLRPILNKIGFDQLELVVCGGAPLAADTAVLWHMYGVNVVEIYGQTETAGGIIAGQRGPFSAPGDVGSAPSGWNVRLSAEGEVLVHSPDIFEGYWHNDEATRAVIGDDGWLRTGDVGEWRNGALRLVDRARDFIVTSGGKTISPSFIENTLRASPYISEAAVFGHGRKYLSALIEIDFDTVADWARTANLAYTGFTSLAENPQVERLVRSEVDKANTQLARVEQIKSFRILPKMLDPEQEGEPVTPTRKVKRALMQQRFKELIDAMYDDREERLLAEEVKDALKLKA
jgi:long-chain acyl-CoA synthetase